MGNVILKNDESILEENISKSELLDRQHWELIMNEKWPEDGDYEELIMSTRGKYRTQVLKNIEELQDHLLGFMDGDYIHWKDEKSLKTWSAEKLGYNIDFKNSASKKETIELIRTEESHNITPVIDIAFQQISGSDIVPKELSGMIFEMRGIGDTADIARVNFAVKLISMYIDSHNIPDLVDNTYENRAAVLGFLLKHDVNPFNSSLKLLDLIMVQRVKDLKNILDFFIEKGAMLYTAHSYYSNGSRVPHGYSIDWRRVMKTIHSSVELNNELFERVHKTLIKKHIIKQRKPGGIFLLKV